MIKGACRIILDAKIALFSAQAALYLELILSNLIIKERRQPDLGLHGW
jgi:hypothetical protein